MKVPRSIRLIYEDQKTTNEQLKGMVDKRILGLKDSRWHYESRVKELVSFALKIETGRFEKPEALEDFFACTIVVANSSELQRAEKLIRENFTLRGRKPKAKKRTLKTPETFPFDDLRLYVTVRDDPAMSPPPPGLSGIVFEVQIKTFLQHAWSIATHDLVYKSDEVDWGKQRIAYQVKAMLEHAEVSIQEAGKLAKSSALAKEDRRTKKIKAGIGLLKSQWDQDKLPSDMRRLAENIVALLELLQLDITRLEVILKDKKDDRGGAHPENLSPYGAVVQYLFEAELDQMQRLLTGDCGKAKVLIPSEIVLPSTCNSATFKNAVFVNGSQMGRV